MFLVHQMAVGLFRLMGAIGRTLVIATSMGSIAVLVVVTMSGFVLAYPQVRLLEHCHILVCQPCLPIGKVTYSTGLSGGYEAHFRITMRLCVVSQGRLHAALQS